MNKPRRPVKNRIMYDKSGVIIVENDSEEFGVSYYLFCPEQFGTLNFSTYEDAIMQAKSYLR